MPAVFALTMNDRRLLAQGLDALAAIGGAPDDVVALRSALRDRIAEALPIPEVPLPVVDDPALIVCTEWVNPRHNAVLAIRDGRVYNTIAPASLAEALEAWALIEYDEADPAEVVKAVANLRALATAATTAADRIDGW